MTKMIFLHFWDDTSLFLRVLCPQPLYNMKAILLLALERVLTRRNLGVCMNIQEVEWKHYPYVAEYSPARSFVERLVLKGKQPNGSLWAPEKRGSMG